MLEAAPEKQAAKLHRLYEAVEALPYMAELLEDTGAENASQLLNAGDLYSGEGLTAFVPLPVMPSHRIYIQGDNTETYSTLLDACYELGCHKVTLQAVAPLPAEFDMRLVGTLTAEAWTKGKWADILLYEKLSPAWTETVGEAVTLQAVPRKRRNGRRKVSPR